MRLARSWAATAALIPFLFVSADLARAATPASGTLSPANATINYTSGPYSATDANPTFNPPTCDATHKCDDFGLTVDLPSGYATAHPNATITITTSWTNPGEDYDNYLQDAAGNYRDRSARTGPGPETITLTVDKVPGGGGSPVNYNIRIVPYQIIGGGNGSGSASTKVVLAANDSTPTPTGASGTVSPGVPVQKHDAGPFTAANATPVLLVDQGPRCNANSPCDNYALTVDLPPGYVAAHPSAAVKVTLSWTDTGSGNSDYDLYIYKGNVTTTSGSQPASYESSSSANPEVTSIFPLVDGSRLYSVKIVPYTPSGEIVHLRMELLPGSGGGGGNGTPGPCDSPLFGGADLPCPGNPRYQNFFPPARSSADQQSQGEFNIGFNPKSGRIITMNIGPIWRITPAELKPGGGAQTSSGMPESCPGLWQDVSDPSTDVGLDPILFTDQKTGRTFATNSTVGGAAIYTDNDGGDPPANDKPNADWKQSAQPPNGGADHEGFASGPFPASLAALATPANQGEYVLYCSQNLVGSTCQRSLTLGTSYENGVPATGPGTNNSQGCGGLHGHERIAPDGTAWIPDKSCSGSPGGAISTDTSTTPWTEFLVKKAVADADGPAFKPASQSSGGADPSIGFDASSVAYYCYVNNEANGTEGHVHVAVGKRQGTGTTIKWIRDADLGASHGIANAAHTEAWGGSAGRATCGFFGTNVPGNYQAGDFTGVWYAYVATTYDEGKTWVTVNATPNDPVQSMTGIWQQGGGGQNGDRNLLDFNEITMDDKGRPLYGYSDGCTSAGCVAGTAGSNLGASMRVARQIGGKSLLASHDSDTDTTAPIVPKRPCLAGMRDDTTAHLSWKIPDNGGADIVNYDVFRSTSKGGPYTNIGTTANAKPLYDDTTSGNTDPDLYYVVKANSAVRLASLDSNEVDLKVTILPPVENVCVIPGLTELTDPAGDTSAALGLVNSPAPPGSDLLSFQISQPYAANGVIKLAFSINTDAGQTPQPAGSAWYVAFKIPGPDPNVAGDTSAVHYRGVHMAWTGATPTFESYTPSTNTSGGTDGRFVKSGSGKPAETGVSGSSYAAPFKRVVIVVKASNLGLAAGDTISGFVSGVSQSTDPGATVGAGATALYDQMPNSLAFSGPAFKLPDNQLCAPNEAPVVETLTADPMSGLAPLTVTFTGTAHDPDPADTVASYTFNFADGTPPVTQASPTIQHTYASAGRYIARVTVTDSRGLASVNSATALITVTSAPAIQTPGNNVLGGANSPAALLVLGLMGLARRRSKPTRL